MRFDAYKVKIGRGDVGADLELIRVVRALIGEEAKLAVDYNQSLSVTGALERVRILDEEGLYWIEEPTSADDFVAALKFASGAFSRKSNCRRLGKITQYPGLMDRMLAQDVVSVVGCAPRCT